MSKIRLSTGQSWSEKWPGYINCGGGTLRLPFEWNGKNVNRYVLEKECSQCRKLHLQDRNNSRTAKNSFCSNECRKAHVSASIRGKRYVKDRTHGRGHHILVKMPDHHRACSHGYVFEHVLVAEEKEKRQILKHERVHHINCIKSDNRPENLFVCSNDREHFAIHGTLNDCVPELIEMGVLQFDAESKCYKVIKS